MTTIVEQLEARALDLRFTRKDAEESGMMACTETTRCDLFDDYAKALDDAIAALKAERAKVIEQCAKACEDQYVTVNDSALDCAEAIRRLAKGE